MCTSGGNPGSERELQSAVGPEALLNILSALVRVHSDVFWESKRVTSGGVINTSRKFDTFNFICFLRALLGEIN